MKRRRILMILILIKDEEKEGGFEHKMRRRKWEILDKTLETVTKIEKTPR